MTAPNIRMESTPTRAATGGLAGPAGERSAAPPGETAKGPTHRISTWVARTVGVLALIAGVALAVWPYQRELVGSFEGQREIVSSSCDAPLIAAFSDRTGNALLDENTWADGPPCQRSAAGRLALAGVIIAVGLAALLAVWSRDRTTNARPPAAS